MIFFFFVNDIKVFYHSQNFKQMNEFEQKLFNVYEMRNLNEIVTDLLLRERNSESSESIKDASRTARCLRKVLRTNRLRRS